MGIDRIGKGGGAPPTPDGQTTGAATPTGKPEKAFEVERTSSTTAAQKTADVEGVAPSSPLARLRAGEIDVNGYVDLKVDDATASLKGVPAAELDEIKKALRDQLRTDPGLVDLVRSATGKMPSPPED